MVVLEWVLFGPAAKHSISGIEKQLVLLLMLPLYTDRRQEKQGGGGLQRHYNSIYASKHPRKLTDSPPSHTHTQSIP